MKPKLFLLACLLLWTGVLFGQREITGVVSSAENNEPLPGVSVAVKGAAIGTVTNLEGEYTIMVPEENAVLIFSFVGMKSMEVPVENKTVIDAVLEVDAMGLDEVVVVGYGTRKKRDVIGSVSSVSSEDISDMAVPSFDAAIQGKAAGVQVVSGGGVIGAPVRIMVRGTNSISSGTEPLYVIDGIPVSSGIESFTRGANSVNPLSTINPNDIESIEVLKDAAATAIYGSRGSNGVILITTKTGKLGQKRLSFDVRTGFSNPVDLVDLAGANDWLTTVDQARANSGLDPFDPQTVVGDNDPDVVLTRDQLADTDWYDVIFQQGTFQEYNLSASNGTGNTNYYISAQYRTDDGILKNNEFDRFNLRSNLDFNPTNNLTMGTRVNLSYLETENVNTGGGIPGGNDNIATGGYGQLMTNALPIFPIYNADGSFFDPLSGNNLKASLNRDWYSDQDEQFRGLASAYVNYKLPIDGLSVQGEYAVDFITTNNIRYGGPELRPAGIAYGFDEGKQFLNTNYNAYLTYLKSFGSHNINLTAGLESFHTTQRERNLEATNLTTSDQEIGAVGGDDVQRVVMGFLPETKFRSYFARAEYNFMQKYYLGLSYRRDGSSKFGADNLFGNFPAVSAGWVISEESFMEALEPLSFLKLRGSYGVTGNASIPQGITQTVFQTWTRYGNTGTGGRLGNIGASDITWETTNSLDFGIDYGLFNNRISGSIAYYDQKISDMLLQVPISRSNGVNSLWANIGDLRNKGIEFSISSVNINTPDFTWRTDFNIATNSNEVEALTPILAESRAGIDANITSTRIGGPLGAFYLASSAGFDDTYGYELIHEVDHNPYLVNEEGDYIDGSGAVVEEPVDNPDYLSKTGNVIPATNSNVSNNRYLNEDKTGIPTYYGGLSNTLSYKGFDLSFMFVFQGGNYIYDEGERSRTNVGEGRGVLNADYIGNYWTESNKNADYPALVWNNTYTYMDSEGAEVTNNFSANTDRFLYKGDFLRLRNIQIAYNLPESITSRLKMQNARIYASGTNLLTFTKYPGLDPEIVNAASSASDRNLVQGVAGTRVLPQLRTFTIGVTLDF